MPRGSLSTRPVLPAGWFLKLHSPFPEAVNSPTPPHCLISIGLTLISSGPRIPKEKWKKDTGHASGTRENSQLTVQTDKLCHREKDTLISPGTGSSACYIDISSCYSYLQLPKLQTHSETMLDQMAWREVPESPTERHFRLPCSCSSLIEHCPRPTNPGGAPRLPLRRGQDSPPSCDNTKNVCSYCQKPLGSHGCVWVASS